MIVLVAVVMLFVIGAMAALSIDVVTLYTARSEAQLAADAAALAAARVLANSGATSDATGTLLASEESPGGPAQTVAIQVAEQNQVAGANLTAANVLSVVFGGPDTDPTVTVKVQVTTLPTFFARIFGTQLLTVAASATAEAYNPSGARAFGKTDPVAPACVKPWLLPNKDPSAPGNPIIRTFSGAIEATSKLLGSTNTMSLASACNGGGCTPPPPSLPIPTTAWTYYPGDQSSFPAPTSSLPTCSQVPTPTPYQESIAGCVQTPISCNSKVNIDTASYLPNDLNTDTFSAVNCLTHTTNNHGDTVTSAAPPPAPFEFVVGADNPVAVVNPALAGQDVMVSDSLVTVPIFDVQGGNGLPCTAAPCSVKIIGFVQLFLNPDGNAAPVPASNPPGINTTVVNIAGCGTAATGTPILGNGASPVAVRLISPP